ncbi:TPA: hypothetical protein ACH3X3_003959 [Trebouxia sp. C0006]
MWMWVAAPAIACLAYNSIVGEANSDEALTFDNVSKSFMFMALSLFFCLGWGFVQGFFGRSKFDMADWGYSFPVDVLAICLIQYSGDVRGSWTRGMAYTALTITTALAIVTALQTCTALAMGQVFRPEDKWGPLSGVMKITHKGIREGIARLEASANA